MAQFDKEKYGKLAKDRKEKGEPNPAHDPKFWESSLDKETPKVERAVHYHKFAESCTPSCPGYAVGAQRRKLVEEAIEKLQAAGVPFSLSHMMGCTVGEAIRERIEEQRKLLDEAEVLTVKWEESFGPGGDEFVYPGSGRRGKS